MANALSVISSSGGSTNPATSSISSGGSNGISGVMYYNSNTGNIETPLYDGSNIWVPLTDVSGSTSTSGSSSKTGGSATSTSTGNVLSDNTAKSSSSSSSATTAAAKAFYDALASSTNSSINDAITGQSNTLKSSILDWLDSRKQAQNTIDANSVQYALAKAQGLQDINDMVSNGIQSGGITLANNNAGSSSATDAIARAYAILARQQASKVGNQFAQNMNTNDTAQNNLLSADTTELRHLGESKEDAINTIVNNARNSLASLNSNAQYSGLTDRVDIEARAAQIRQQAIDALSSLDAQLASGISSNGAMSKSDVNQKAAALLAAGVAPTTSYDYTTDVPTTLQNTGQFASSLPIFTSSKKYTA